MPIDCCYFVDKAAAAGAAPALKNFCSILHCPAVFTQNLGPLLADLIQPECANQFGGGILNDAYNKNWPILGNFICGHHLSYFDALFAVNTHANFNLVFVYAKGCLANFRNDAGGQSNAHGAGVVNRLLSYCGYFFQVHHTFGSNTGTTVTGADHIGYLGISRRCKNVAYAATVQHAVANISARISIHGAPQTGTR